MPRIIDPDDNDLLGAAVATAYNFLKTLLSSVVQVWLIKFGHRPLSLKVTYIKNSM